MRENRRKNPPLAIIGLGKLAARIELRIDLDILFVAGPGKEKKPARIATAWRRNSWNCSPARRTGGCLRDRRPLRPDGEKGLLVNTVDAMRLLSPSRDAVGNSNA